MKKTNKRIPKHEKGAVIKQKLVDWLNKNGSSISRIEAAELRKGIEDLNPDMFYSINEDKEGYLTFKQDDSGKWNESSDFGAGIYKKDGKLSRNRSGFLQTLSGNRKYAAYGGRENPRRIKDALIKAKELNILRNIKDEEGQSKSTDTTGNSNAATSIDDLIGTTPTNVLNKNGIDYVTVDGQEIPVKIGPDGKIQSIIAIEDVAIDAVEGTGQDAKFKDGIDPYTTGVDLFDESSNNQDASTSDTIPTDEEGNIVFTDGRLFQKYLIDKAKAANMTVTGRMLGVKTAVDTHNGVPIDGKVGDLTMALATKLGVADKWKGNMFKNKKVTVTQDSPQNVDEDISDDPIKDKDTKLKEIEDEVKRIIDPTSAQYGYVKRLQELFTEYANLTGKFYPNADTLLKMTEQASKTEDSPTLEAKIRDNNMDRVNHEGRIQYGNTDDLRYKFRPDIYTGSQGTSNTSTSSTSVDLNQGKQITKGSELFPFFGIKSGEYSKEDKQKDIDTLNKKIEGLSRFKDSNPKAYEQSLTKLLKEYKELTGQDHPVASMKTGGVVSKYENGGSLDLSYLDDLLSFSTSYESGSLQDYFNKKSARKEESQPVNFTKKGAL